MEEQDRSSVGSGDGFGPNVERALEICRGENVSRTTDGHEAARIAQELIAEDALIQPAPPGTKGRGREKWQDQIIGSLGVAIAGGASNIQRNIIAERGLGLPRDTTGDAA